MSKGLNILFCTSEVTPYSKTGGLADVSNSLPQELAAAGHAVRIITPKYGPMDERRLRVYEIKRLVNIEVPVADRITTCNIKSSFIVSPKGKVQVFLIENNEYFRENSPYVDEKTGKDYENNDERFIFFNRAIVQVLGLLGWKPDIIHCNDWQTGLIPAYIKTIYAKDPLLQNVKSVFTIHNIAFQGLFPYESFLKSGLPHNIWNEEGVEYYNQFSFLKTAIVYSDAITTVSENYAREIATTHEYGMGFEGLLKTRKKDLFGILNGVDYSVWNPEKDNLIPFRYNAMELPLKRENKKVLCKKFGIEYNSETPLIGIISRLTDQKGFDLIKKIMPDLMKENVNFILLGTGDKNYQKFFEGIKKKFPKKVGLHFGFSEELAHLIEAGSDIFLMPSKYEPCGLNQMYSLKYGTIPVVRKTGGLADTITEYKNGKGNGFTFDKYDASELMKAVKKALKLYKNREEWIKLIRNAMSYDYSWQVSARKYIDLYKTLLKKS
ncbi:MAG: glycogen synthase GlgA [Ignavibacteria bacterium]|nr:glycogen synthase GlgA [Ignavibacteria bacterium]